MVDRIAFVKTGWSEEYAGGRVVGRFTYIGYEGDGHEKFNFQKGQNELFYAYIPPIGRNRRPPQPQETNNWLIIFVSARNGIGRLTVVGWYEHATFEREYRDRPEYESVYDFPTDVDDRNYEYCIRSSSAQLITVENRNHIVLGDHFRRTPIIYARGNGQDDEWREELAILAEEIVGNPELRSTNNTRPTFRGN